MNGLASRFAVLAAAASLSASPLPANEAPVPGKPPRPTLTDVLALQARLEEIKNGDLPDERKIAELLKLKNAIAEAWPQIIREQGLDAPAAEGTPDDYDPTDLYFRGWLLSREAGMLEDEGKPAEALKKLEIARQLFDRVARDFPDWKPAMVAGRRKKTTEHQAALSKHEVAPDPK
jgi:hypothetical protein